MIDTIQLSGMEYLRHCLTRDYLRGWISHLEYVEGLRELERMT